jgi:hypothetical protein
MTLSAEMAANLGPLAALAGTWEGDKGIDVAMSSEGPKETRFRERLTLDPLGPVNNTKQVLYGLKYATTAWPLGEEKAFHQEVGYWLYDAQAGLVMRAFMVPRGVLVNAGAQVAADASSFTLHADHGSTSFGVLSNPVIEDMANTVHYEVTITVNADGSFHYKENTQLQFRGTGAVFDHTDENTLVRVS